MQKSVFFSCFLCKCGWIPGAPLDERLMPTGRFPRCFVLQPIQRLGCHSTIEKNKFHVCRPLRTSLTYLTEGRGLQREVLLSRLCFIFSKVSLKIVSRVYKRRGFCAPLTPLDRRCNTYQVVIRRCNGGENIGCRAQRYVQLL